MRTPSCAFFSTKLLDKYSTIDSFPSSMIHEFDTSFLGSRASCGSPSPAARRSSVINETAASHSLTNALGQDPLRSGSAVFPAYVFRRAGLLDPVGERLAHYHE
jgi:hypothetical protein